MPNQTSSSASSTSPKSGKTQDSKDFRSKMMPISTMGQGQAMLLAQATLPAQTDEQVAQEGENASASEKGKSSRPSMRAALSSIKDKAKRLSFSTSASGKDDDTLASSASVKDDATLVDREEYEKRENEKREAENKAFGLGKKGVGKGGVQIA